MRQLDILFVTGRNTFNRNKGITHSFTRVIFLAFKYILYGESRSETEKEGGGWEGVTCRKAPRQSNPLR